MISIFQKKIHLTDLLEGFTDFHNHLLPGIDDGAATPEDSLEMIRRFGEFGVRDFVATPHVMGEYYPNTPQTIKAAYEKLKNRLPEGVTLGTSGEYMMDQFLLESLEQEKLLSIKGKYLLVEMSFFQAPINLKEILFKLQNHSYKPILAHPERYAFYHSKKMEQYRELKSRSCFFQLNMLSLTPHYGPGIQKMAFQLLENEMIDFLSSDCHRPEHLDKISAIRLSKKQIRLIEPVIERSKAIFKF